jgi:hypothetical protein
VTTHLPPSRSLAISLADLEREQHLKGLILVTKMNMMSYDLLVDSVATFGEVHKMSLVASHIFVRLRGLLV